MRVRAIVLGVFLPVFLWAFGFEVVVFGGAAIDMPGIDCPAAGAASAEAAIADESRQKRFKLCPLLCNAPPTSAEGASPFALSNCSSCRCRDRSGNRLRWRSRTCRLHSSERRSFSLSIYRCSTVSESPYNFRTMVQSQGLHS